MTVAPARYEALDIVRIVAAVGVLLYHAETRLHVDFGVLTPVVSSLGLGVLAFFSLSGYLVFRPFLRGRVSTGEHVTRRMLRIVPAYLVAVVGTVVVLPQLDPYLGGVAWTLFVEALFYLVLPLLVVAMVAIAGPTHRRQVAFLLVLGAVSLAARYAVLGTDGRSWDVIGRFPPLWFWAFIPGMLVACALAWSPPLAARLADRRVLAVGAAIILTTLLVPTDTYGPVELTRAVAMAMGTALIIPGLLTLRLPGRAAVATATAGRTLSYPVYLWQVTVMTVVAALGGWGWTGLAVTIAGVVLVSFLSWRLIERPAIELSRWSIARASRPRTDLEQAGPLVSESPRSEPVSA